VSRWSAATSPRCRKVRRLRAEDG